MIRVLLADDQALVRAGFRALLDAEADIEVVGEVGDGAAAVRLAKQTSPDVILMDIRMPLVDGLEATRQIAAEPTLSATRVIILTTFDLDEYVFEALRVGASADRVLIEIQDACGGLPGGDVNELFRPFEQRSADRTGLGLGLAFSRWGVEANGGRIYARNLPERGCVFTIDLPRISVPLVMMV